MNQSIIDHLQINKDMVKPVVETKFIKVYDLQHSEGKHYYDATRRDAQNIVAIKTDEEFKNMLPDAVSCFLIIETPDAEPVLLLFYEYRYPIGRYVLSIPAGLIDEKDRAMGEGDLPLIEAMKREIKEETGITVKDTDEIKALNRVAFMTSGMTDESNGIVGAVVHLDDLSSLSHSGAEGGEQFEDFILADKKMAKELLRNQVDEKGDHYPFVTYTALMYFVSDLWR